VPWPPPRRVYVVEVDMDAEFLSIAARIQEALAAAGEAHPQVEVVPTSVELPVYQSAARAYGALLWARDPERELRLAKPFGGVGEEGDPSFDPDHPRIHDPVERNLVLRYLELGEPILFANAMTKDIVKPDRGEVVPFDVRTDGTWIWFDATAYYLSRHQLAPPADFLDHIRSAEYLAPVADGVAWHRAVAHLVKLQPGELPTEPVIEPVAEDETEPVIDEPVIDQEPAAEEPEPAPAAVVQAPPLNPIAAALMPNPIAAILEQDPMSEAAAPPAEAEGEPATPVFSDADIPEIAALKNITTLKVTAGGPATPVL